MSGGIDLLVEVSDPRWPAAFAEGLEALVRETLAAADGPTDPVELGIVLSDDAAVRSLNRAWRGRDRPTNVLSFAAQEGEGPGGACLLPLQLGDLVLAYETVAAEAAEQGKAFADHARHLVVHGILHLLGFDHISEDEAAEMERLETLILAGLGIADPYAEIDDAIDADERRPAPRA